MCHALLHDPRFFTLLQQIDGELAAHTRALGCVCSGLLHRANYPRKPRGCPPEARGSVERRFSFCCERCRKPYIPRMLQRNSSQLPRRCGARWMRVKAQAVARRR